MNQFAASEGYTVKGLSFSPITGGDGNIEFLLHLEWGGEDGNGAELPEEDILRTVREAHETLKAKRQMYRNNRGYYSFFLPSCTFYQEAVNIMTRTA